MAQKGFYVGKKKTFLAPWAVDLIAELVKEENTEWIENISQIATQFLFIKTNSVEKVFFSTNRFIPLKTISFKSCILGGLSFSNFNFLINKIS